MFSILVTILQVLPVQKLTFSGNKKPKRISSHKKASRHEGDAENSKYMNSTAGIMAKSKGGVIATLEYIGT